MDDLLEIKPGLTFIYYFAFNFFYEENLIEWTVKQSLLEKKLFNSKQFKTVENVLK